MLKGVWGKKIGMTQLFENDQVIPVTAIDVVSWVVTQTKTDANDGYNAVQVGCKRRRYQDVSTMPSGKKLKDFFEFVREVPVEGSSESLPSKGQDVAALEVIQVGDFVDVRGKTRGRGFQGGVKRHGFTGGRASHGSKMGKRRPGAIGWMRRQGRIIKGKRMAGHMGADQRMMKNLRVIKVEKDAGVVFVKGSIPGHTGSLVFIRKR